MDKYPPTKGRINMSDEEFHIILKAKEGINDIITFALSNRCEEITVSKLNKSCDFYEVAVEELINVVLVLGKITEGKGKIEIGKGKSLSDDGGYLIKNETGIVQRTDNN